MIAEGEPRLLLLGTPGAVRRGGAGRDDRRADLLPERGRAGGLHRAGAARAAPGGRRPLADGAHAGRPGPGARLAHRRWWTARTSPRPTPTSARWSSWPPRATATRRPSSRRSPPGPPTSAWSARAAAARRCSATSPTAACPQDQLDRVRVPAGLDLGRTTHREIAVAILAELVQLRASGALAPRPPRRRRPRPSRAGRGDRPGLRDDRGRGRRPAARWSTTASPTTSAAPAAAGRSSRTPPPTLKKETRC